MKLNKFVVSCLAIFALGQGVQAVNLNHAQSNEGIKCIYDNLGKVSCEATPAISLAETENENEEDGEANAPAIGYGENGELDIYGKPIDGYQKILITVFFF